MGADLLARSLSPAHPRSFKNDAIYRRTRHQKWAGARAAERQNSFGREAQFAIWSIRVSRREALYKAGAIFPGISPAPKMLSSWNTW